MMTPTLQWILFDHIQDSILQGKLNKGLLAELPNLGVIPILSLRRIGMIPVCYAYHVLACPHADHYQFSWGKRR